MGESAENLIHKAEKKLQGSFFSFFSGDDKFEEASSLYIQAANQYKLEKSWKMVAKCYIKAADMQRKIGDSNQEANFLVEAANSIKKYSHSEAEEYFSKAISIFLKQGRFNQSAKIMKNQAENFLEEGDITKAIKFFKNAAEYFEMEEFGTSSYRTCILKYADLISFHNSKFQEAINIYEIEGKKALKNNLLQYSAKDYFFKAGLLYLAVGDIIDSKIAIERYQSLDSRIGTSSELNFLQDISTAIESQDINDFTYIIEQYDRIHKLDDWKIHFLYMIKEALHGNFIENPVNNSEGIDLS